MTQQNKVKCGFIRKICQLFYAAHFNRIILFGQYLDSRSQKVEIAA